MRRVNMPINAPSKGYAEAIAREALRDNHKAGTIVGSALSSNQRPDSKVVAYAPANKNNRTYVVYIELTSNEWP